MPDAYDPSEPAPLLVLLHGFNMTGALQSKYYGLRAVANDYGMLYAHPDGTTNALGEQFWNATDACCDHFDENPDDSSYLRSLIEEIATRFNVDAKRTFFMGLSNGAFMSHRMACDHADLIAGIAAHAGSTWNDPSNCDPSEPVHVLSIMGTEDYLYDGELNGMPIERSRCAAGVSSVAPSRS